MFNYVHADPVWNEVVNDPAIPAGRTRERARATIWRMRGGSFRIQ